MPPRTRGTKDLKENIDVVKRKVKPDGRKSIRKALADKTNSLSDDNESIDIPIKSSKKILNTKSTTPNQDNQIRPRRQRRLPPRYVENQILKNISNTKESTIKHIPVTSKTETPTKKPTVKEFSNKTAHDPKSTKEHETEIVLPAKQVSKDKEETKRSKITSVNIDKQVPITEFLTKDKTRPKRSWRVQSILERPSKDNLNVSSLLKTPFKDAENSLIASRPKRVHRLPSRLKDHSISPNKFIAVLPCHASTPIIQKTTKIANKYDQNVSVEKKKNVKTKKDGNKISKVTKSKPIAAFNTSNSSSKSSPDTNNNGKNRILRNKRVIVKTKLPTKQVSPNIKNENAKRLLEKSFSFRVFEGKQSNEKDLDVYEFTFDPDEEPPPQKKKRKKTVKKRPAKPKTVIFKSNYDINISKAIANLKTKVKPSQNKMVQSGFKPREGLEKPAEINYKLIDNQVKLSENQTKTTENCKAIENAKPIELIQSSLYSKPICDNVPLSNYSANAAIPNESLNPIHASNYASICVEDIAAGLEFSDNHDINYSPVPSPHPPSNHEQNCKITGTTETNQTVDHVNNKDPLNLHDDYSFFEPPIASSSMNVSIRQPHASPWRVEFGSLPVKWHNNTYVKPNMTPAVECSFVNSESATKKHVYTNMLPETEQLPEIFENPAPALKQTSIISFIKEVAERKANKKKRRQSETHTQGIIDDFAQNPNEGHKSPKKAKLSKDSTNTSNNTNDTSTDKENINDTCNKDPEGMVNKLIEKEKNNEDVTFFGFDESENVDQENVSPVKIKRNLKTKVLRSRNVLQELNAQPMPTRATLPVTKAKIASSEVVAQLFDQLKSAEDAQFPEKTAEEPDNTITTNVDLSMCDIDDDSESVHLFEDIEVVHHLKPHRKSYGKAKKVTFQHSANSDDSDDRQPPVGEESSDEDDLADLSFHLPDVKEKRKRTKKKKPKNLLTKKEEKEVEEWAAGFNSMCEDIDEFPLLVE